MLTTTTGARGAAGQVHEVPGDHDSMVLEPNVRVLAALMRRAIEAAEARAAGKGAIVVPGQRGGVRGIPSPFS